MTPRLSSADAPDGRVGLASVFRSRTFVVLYVAEAQSVVGDQLARVAFAVVVFDATESTAATALAYATTFLPALLGGWLVAGIGDRWNRRGVLALCELVRAALFVAMCLPGMPITAMLALLAMAVVLGPVFVAVEVSCLAAALDPERFRVATGLRMSTGQLAQVLGFAAGGALVTWLSPRGVLLLDAATFVVSAVMVGGLLPRTAGRTKSGATPTVAERAPDPSERNSGSRRILWTDPRIRTLLAFSLLISFYVAPEALAIPLGRENALSATRVGLLLAAIPLGAAVGALVLVKYSPPRARLRTSRAMAVLAGVPLFAVLGSPSFGWLLALWLLTGLLCAYQVELTANLVSRLPADARARLLGAIGALLLAGQGLMTIVFGVIAQLIGVAPAISLAGATGIVCALLLCFDERRKSTPTVVGRHHITL